MAEPRRESRSSSVALIPRDYVIFPVVAKIQGCKVTKTSHGARRLRPLSGTIDGDAVHGGILVSSLWASGVSGHQPHHCDVGRQMNADCL